jgi:hypothetical protein
MFDFGQIVKKFARTKGQPAGPAAKPKMQAPMTPGVKDPTQQLQQPILGQRQPAATQLPQPAPTMSQTAMTPQVDPTTGLPRKKQPAQQAGMMGLLSKLGGEI